MGKDSMPVNKLILRPDVKGRFEEVLHEKASAFLASVASAVSSNPSLSGCDPMSVMGSAMIAATLDLPINQNLGFAYIVPYKTKGVARAQFQMGYKGYIQLAIRTGQYKTIAVKAIYEDEIESFDDITEEIVFTARESRKMRKAGDPKNIVGYYAYFKLTSGFEKFIFRYTEEVEKHARQYSANYRKYGSGLWADNFESMAQKTVLKELISKWGIMSTQMEKAVNYDYGTVKFGKEDVEYLDNQDESNADMVVDVKEMAGEIFDDADEPTETTE